jgi:hypothetical protein
MLLPSTIYSNFFYCLHKILKDAMREKEVVGSNHNAVGMMYERREVVQKKVKEGNVEFERCKIGTI